MAADGPSSIVKAAADGKAAAASIISKFGIANSVVVPPSPEVDLHEMMVRRSRREYRVQPAHTPLDERDNFDETVLGYTEEEARAEAARCLDCDLICSLCVGVCPNMALMTYEVEPARFDLPMLSAVNGDIVLGDRHEYAITQGFQIAVLTDFCNECGNCTTACPTSGDPYIDKPRLYLNREDFEAEKTNAFMMFADGTMEARVDGETHRLSLNSAVEYSTPSVTAKLEPETLAVLEATPGEVVAGESISLEPAALMYKLSEGLRASMPHLPLMAESAGDVRAPPRLRGVIDRGVDSVIPRVHADAVDFDTPDDDAYGRVTNPERFGAVVDAARALIEHLASTYEVEVTRARGGFRVGFTQWGDPESETIHLIPAMGAPLSFVVTAFPGVYIRFGEWEAQGFPACGCDACGEPPENVVEHMDELVGAVVGGRFKEELARHRLKVSFFGDWGGESSDSRLEAGRWREYGELGVHRWPRWPSRV